MRTDPCTKHFVCPRGQEHRGIHRDGKMMGKNGISVTGKSLTSEAEQICNWRWHKIISQRTILAMRRCWAPKLERQRCKCINDSWVCTKEVREIRNSDFLLQISTPLHLQHFTCHGQGEYFNPTPSAPLHCDYYTLKSRNLQNGSKIKTFK